MALVRALIDAGPLVAYYKKKDPWHSKVRNFFEIYKGTLITSEPVSTEVMWLLNSDWRVQNEFLKDLHAELYKVQSLILEDFQYIATLNEKYKDLPGDYADLSIVALASRTGINHVVSLDSDFNIYRQYGKRSFIQLLKAE